MKHNHKRPLSDFIPDIDTLRAAGFKPIACSQLYLEDVFVFETNAEAKDAYGKMEKKGSLCAWWYGREEFEKQVKKYERKCECRVLVYWLQ